MRWKLGATRGLVLSGMGAQPRRPLKPHRALRHAHSPVCPQSSQLQLSLPRSHPASRRRVLLVLVAATVLRPPPFPHTSTPPHITHDRTRKTPKVHSRPRIPTKCACETTRRSRASSRRPHLRPPRLRLLLQTRPTRTEREASALMYEWAPLKCTVASVPSRGSMALTPPGWRVRKRVTS